MEFAKIDNDNKVLQVIVADQGFIDSQQGVFIQVDPDGLSPKNQPRIGGSYDYKRNAFVSKKPYDSWVLDENTCMYVAPLPYPKDSFDYKWDEKNLCWIKM